MRKKRSNGSEAIPILKIAGPNAQSHAAKRCLPHMTGACVASSKFQITLSLLGGITNGRLLILMDLVSVIKTLLASARLHTTPEADKPAPEALCSGDEAANGETQIPGSVELLACAVV